MSTHKDVCTERCLHGEILHKDLFTKTDVHTRICLHSQMPSPTEGYRETRLTDRHQSPHDENKGRGKCLHNAYKCLLIEITEFYTRRDIHTQNVNTEKFQKSR